MRYIRTTSASVVAWTNMLIAVGCHDVINRWEGRFGGHALLEVVSGYDDASSKPNPDR